MAHNFLPVCKRKVGVTTKINRAVDYHKILKGIE